MVLVSHLGVYLKLSIIIIIKKEMAKLIQLCKFKNKIKKKINSYKERNKKNVKKKKKKTLNQTLMNGLSAAPWLVNEVLRVGSEH